MTDRITDLGPLGKTSVYIDRYDSGLLFPIPREGSRKETGFGVAAAIFGEDIWNGYEVSWLNGRGKPVVRMVELRVPANSPNLIESKSLKLYLNSFNQSVFERASDVLERMTLDLSQAAGADVCVALLALSHQWDNPPDAVCVDALDIDVSVYQPDASMLVCDETEAEGGWLCSHLLKSNCPVTGQPDWGSVYVRYKGNRIQPESLLAYIVSMRQHQGFHEQCVEQIFCDIIRRCSPEELIVCARYVRRGGLDINPVRSTMDVRPFPNFRLGRQ